MALSPEGHRLAYTASVGNDPRIVMLHLDYPSVRRTVRIDPERTASAAPAAPPDLRFLRWATADRLVYAPAARIVPLPPVTDAAGRSVPNPDGPAIVSPIFAADADGKQRGALVDARDFIETSADARRSLADLLRTPKQLQASRNEPLRWRMPHLDILGFFPAEREQLIIQTRGGYAMPTQHLVDIRSGTVREFGGDWPTPPGDPQVFDWFRLKTVGERRAGARPTTVWQDEELARIQQALETKFPRRAVEIVDWSETRARVLVRVTGGSDPGRIFVWQRPEDTVVEVLRCAPWLTAARLNETRFFEFAAPDGARLSGYLTWPKKPRTEAPPLLVVFPEGFPGHAQPAFDPEAQVWADLGFAVARLNHRAVAGVPTEDAAALRTAVDRVAADDALAAVAWLAAERPARVFDRTRVAALGRGFGGYLALRALQLEPGAFRCGVAFDAPLDLRAWLQPQDAAGSAAAAQAARTVPVALLDHPAADWRKRSVLEADGPASPVLLLVDPARGPALATAAAAWRARLEPLGRAPAIVETDAAFSAAQPAARAAVYRKIGDFFDRHLHDRAAAADAGKEVE